MNIEQMEEEYLRDSGNHCPYCYSRDITAGPLDVEGMSAWQEVDCEKCGQKWNDIFQLVGIELI